MVVLKNITFMGTSTAIRLRFLNADFRAAGAGCRQQHLRLSSVFGAAVSLNPLRPMTTEIA